MSEQDWRRQLPDEQGWWWWWNEDPDDCPVPVSIMKEGPPECRCFATAGQLGWTCHQHVHDMGGVWIRLPEPATPDSQPEPDHLAKVDALPGRGPGR